MFTLSDGVSLRVHILSGRRDFARAGSFCILVDIYRATSTIPVILSRGAKYVIPFSRIRDIRRFSRENPDVVTVGERFGIKIPSLDYNNSPSEMSSADLQGKVVAITSTNGTRALRRLKPGNEIITGSFVNHTATFNYARNRDEVWIIRADRPDGVSDEDNIYADFLKECLTGFSPNPDEYIRMVRECGGSRILARLGATADIDMALNLDSVGFAVIFRDGKFYRLE